MLKINKNKIINIYSHISVITTRNTEYNLTNLNWKNKNIRCLIEVNIKKYNDINIEKIKVELLSQDGKLTKFNYDLFNDTNNYFIEVKPKINYCIKIKLFISNSKCLYFTKFYKFPEYLLQDIQLPQNKLIIKSNEIDNNLSSKLTKISNEYIEISSNSEDENSSNNESYSSEEISEELSEELSEEINKVLSNEEII